MAYDIYEQFGYLKVFLYLFQNIFQVQSVIETHTWDITG